MKRIKPDFFDNYHIVNKNHSNLDLVYHKLQITILDKPFFLNETKNKQNLIFEK